MGRPLHHNRRSLLALHTLAFLKPETGIAGVVELGDDGRPAGQKKKTGHQRELERRAEQARLFRFCAAGSRKHLRNIAHYRALRILSSMAVVG